MAGLDATPPELLVLEPPDVLVLAGVDVLALEPPDVLVLAGVDEVAALPPPDVLELLLLPQPATTAPLITTTDNNEQSLLTIGAPSRFDTDRRRRRRIPTPRRRSPNVITDCGKPTRVPPKCGISLGSNRSHRGSRGAVRSSARGLGP
jgi:hypothetical protein